MCCAQVGSGAGAGYNVNVAWVGGGHGDAEYIAAFQHVLMPVAVSYDPDLVIISAGFDAAEGDPLGGCSLTPTGSPAAHVISCAPFPLLMLCLLPLPACRLRTPDAHAAEFSGRACGGCAGGRLQLEVHL